jgi:hypothetical protein
MVDGQNVYCGYLTVPENRAVPAGRTLRLAVAFLANPNVRPNSSCIRQMSGRQWVVTPPN